jgi:hypothetical protein
MLKDSTDPGLYNDFEAHINILFVFPHFYLYDVGIAHFYFIEIIRTSPLGCG